MIQTRSIRRRLSIAVVVVFAIIATFIVRLADLQVVRADELHGQAAQQQTIAQTTYGTRGSIVDANGAVLADSVERWDITASPKDAYPDDPEKQGFLRRGADGGAVRVTVADALAEIAQITGGDAASMQAALDEDRTANHAYLVRAVKLDQFQKVRDLDIPWVYDEPNPSRTYPSGAIGGNLVGFLGTDGPLAGTELKWDECLAATDGTQTYERSQDNVRMPGSTVVEKPAIDGGTVRLTIDSDLQWYAQQVMEEQGTALGAKWGTAAVVRVSDGHIMAAADWPTVDPNDLDSVPSDSLGSRFFTFPYEPGSIMKPATVASLLDAGVLTPTDRFTVPGRYTTGLPTGSYIKDAWAHDEVRWTTAGILMNSSNVGISMMSERMSVQQRHDYLQRFGFGTATGVDFLGEESGTLIDAGSVDPITDKAQQFGQGITVTSAQMASLYQTLGNGGVRKPLTLVESCTHPDGTVTTAPTAEDERVVSETSARQTVEIMETVASEGTLRNVIGVPGYRIAAKTGTAQLQEGGVYRDKRIVSVAGLVSVDHPDYAVVVTFGEPDKIRTSAGAAPAFAAITKQVIKTFRVQPSTVPAPDVPLTW